MALKKSQHKYIKYKEEQEEEQEERIIALI